jgi:hypothetical protein
MNNKKDFSAIHKLALICVGVGTVVFFFFKILLG